MFEKIKNSAMDWLRIFKLKTQGRFDVLSPLAMVILGVIGVMFIYSAQLERMGTAWKAQCVFWVIGLLLYAAVSLIDYRFWLTYAHWIYLACIVTLVLVLVIGDRQFGAQRWINFGLFKYQPSETAKVGVLLFAASILARSRVGTVKDSLLTLGKLGLLAGAPIFLIFLQPDLKSAIVLPPMIFAMLFVSRLSLRFFAVALGAFVVLVSVIAWDTAAYVRFMERNGYSYHNVEQRDLYNKRSPLPLRGYQRNRILAFAAPNIIDKAGTGAAYNLTQSLISVGSGGLAGKGWREGTQAKLGYLPTAVSHNDFIVSVIAEETGFLGSLTVIGLFGIILFNSIRIAGIARDRFGTLIAIGVAMFFAVHVFVNIAMSIGLVPITGIPLPFISYGGSFVLTCCVLQGLVQSVYRFRKDFS